MAPVRRTPSSPRLILPLFSVRHSPRLTKRKGVPPRTAPARTPMTTPHQPMDALATISIQIEGSESRSAFLEKFESAVKRIAKQDDQEHQPLKNQDRGVRQLEFSLQNSAARQNTAKKCGHYQDGQTSMPCHKSDQDPRVTVTG